MGFPSREREPTDARDFYNHIAHEKRENGHWGKQVGGGGHPADISKKTSREARPCPAHYIYPSFLKYATQVISPIIEDSDGGNTENRDSGGENGVGGPSIPD